MPKITIKIMFGPLRSLTGLDELNVEAEEFKEILEKLSKMYGEQVYDIFFSKDGSPHPFNHIIIDGKTYTAQEALNMKFKEDKTIYLWPALDGGV
ncbi:MAG: hypothetical protein NDF58_05460 [archaeon YNP-LCB-024-027]|jgi:molybdopterin converting factor small subunit|nr:hypothetical protein [Candidatus Culexarchaeum yellowstonense]